MPPRVFGIETEYGLSAVDSRGRRKNQAHVLDALLRRARAVLPHLPDGHSTGLFLRNGARFYVDCGGHPEMTTPECTNPWDAVRYVRAGEAVLQQVASEDTSIFRANVDYSGSHATWGCHESYMYACDPSVLPAQLIPHLVSRVVFTGAGGFSNVSAGIEFTLSPRAVHIGTDVSSDSTGYRGIFHTKNEPLCGGSYNRLHVIFGESLCSDLATWLKIGTTALVVALCDAGLRPGDGVTLKTPVMAMRIFANDPSCAATVPAAGRAPVTALDVQRHYLALAEEHAGAAFMPPWAGDVCRTWRETLDRLSLGWEAASAMLDWAIKLGLYRERAGRHGFAWDAVRSWNQVVRLVGAAMGRASLPPRALTAKLISDRSSPIAADVAALAPRLEGLGLAWRDFPEFLALRDELFEADMRFGQLAPRGIFAALEDAGVLAHRVPGAGDVARATEHPPDGSRARVRGELVRALADHDGGRYHCDWQGVWDAQSRRCVDLSDPFATSADWKPWARDDRPMPSRVSDPVAMSMQALEFRKRNRLDEAERLLRQGIELEDAQVRPDSPKRAHRRNNLALVLLRADKLADACAVNADAWALKAGQHDVTSGRILFVRIAIRMLLGLQDVHFFMGQLKTLLATSPLRCLGGVTATWDVADVTRMLRGRVSRDQGELLRRVVRALDARPAGLERLTQWNEVHAVALEVPWGRAEARTPASSHG